MESLIFDFDGVIGNTFEPFAEYYARIGRVSLETARKRLILNGMNNHHETFVNKLILSVYYRGFRKFLKTKGDLLFEDRLADILRLPNPKAILTRNVSVICKDLLGDKAKEFKYIFGRDSSHSKLLGLQKICTDPQFPMDKCMFFTDTVGDVEEISKILDTKQIYGVDWGFHGRELLEKVLPKERVLNSFLGLEGEVV